KAHTCFRWTLRSATDLICTALPSERCCSPSRANGLSMRCYRVRSPRSLRKRSPTRPCCESSWQKSANADMPWTSSNLRTTCAVLRRRYLAPTVRYWAASILRAPVPDLGRNGDMNWLRYCSRQRQSCHRPCIMRHWSRFDTFLDGPNLQDVSERSWLLPKT